MTKQDVMAKFGFTNTDEFETLLIDLGIDPESETLTDAEVETVRNHITVFATSLTALPVAEVPSEQPNYTPPAGAMSVITNQGLQLAKETGLQISQGALETLSQLTFDKGRLDAAFLENAYWFGLLRQQNQLRAANTEKFIKLLQSQQNSNVDIEKLAADAGLLSNDELLKKLSAVSVPSNGLNNAVAAATVW